MSIQNVCFFGEIRKMFTDIPLIQLHLIPLEPPSVPHNPFQHFKLHADLENKVKAIKI